MRTRRSRSASSTCCGPRSSRASYRSARRSIRRSMPSAATASAPTTARRTCCMPRCAATSARTSRQKGSLVAPDYFRFDFSHPKALTREEIDAVEAEVNAQIRSNEPVTTRLMTPDEAIAAGAMALFGEKYGDEVRVLSMGRRRRRRLFGRAVRRHPRPRARRHPAAQDHRRKRGLVRRPPDRGADRRGGAPLARRPRREAARSRGDAQDRRPTKCRRASRRWSRSAGGSSASSPTRRRRSRWAAAPPRPTAPAPEDVGGHKFIGQVVEGLDPKGLRADR